MLALPGISDPVQMNVFCGIVVDRVGIHGIDDTEVHPPSSDRCGRSSHIQMAVLTFAMELGTWMAQPVEFFL